ncbi:DUF320-domain-containing protein [Conidiobolus coronatus NRRL 28638]|uniref:DUF320-domain-containing protein n=1 Tax=Conidiobolus coronatus (strain ATCC 28846 / CBS 209.66 / NRRL 28638) TaxID=796925 RepID=A0A137NX25_CONC2|nr:DUF320-domain-containing protein [Conidiobolus coronatus NRRL 28638]|eukprot:KXN67277.1 DUF320-domain-containing protein [Conidiobolus coronatus NRRL 28638]
MKFLIVLSALAQLAYSNPIDATGASESPGTLSGNVVQLPLDIPVNAVGNTINVIGAGNPTFGNSGILIPWKLNFYIIQSKFNIFTMKFLIVISALAQIALGTPIDATGASQSPGTLSGNVIQLPLDIPVNAVGNTINVIGAGNPTFGNEGTNTSTNL